MLVAIALALSRLIYLDRDGATLQPGVNDSRAQTSSLVSHQVHVPAWSVSDTDWDATVACVREVWSPFGVTITEDDPGDVPHIEVVLGGKAADLGMTVNAGGVSPFRGDCGVIENSIVFAFTAVLPHVPRTICEVASQELGHSFGLDHELDAADPMTYLAYHGPRAFQDEDVACGESVARPCGNSCRPTQNSVQILRSRLGTPDDVPQTRTETSDHATPAIEPDPVDPDLGEPAGCSTSGGSASLAIGLLFGLPFRRARGRRSRSRRPGSAGSEPGARGSCASSSRPSSG